MDFIATTTSSSSAAQGAIAVVDPFSTGAHLASQVLKRGLRCVRVLSVWDSPITNLVQEGFGNLEFAATVQHNDRAEDQQKAIAETVQSLRNLPFPVLAVLPGAETGVELSDQLSFHLGLRTNGVEQSLARRNKYVMGETVRNAGVRAVKQARCCTVEEVQAFLETLKTPGSTNGELKCVVKPVQSAGTDDVFLCENETEALTAFRRILGTVNGIGLLNDSVLVQEFLVGKEYVIDKVSRDGVHKIAAVWEYDKRKVNGANFVYFGMRLIRPDSEKVRVMLDYADQILDAVGIMNGPSHMEVMLKTVQTAEGETYDPCLVEVGARCHGGEGTWLPVALECVGYNQVILTLDAYLGGELFNSVDKTVYPMNKAGRDVDLVSRYGGILRSLPGDAVIRKLPSFRSVSWEVALGAYCSLTIDCFTRPGCVQLVADTEEEADRDFEAIHDLEESGMLDYALLCPKPSTEGVVVTVGVDVALLVQLTALAYKVVVVVATDEQQSQLSDELAKAVQTLHHEDEQKTALALNSLGPILALAAVDETHADLATKLKALCSINTPTMETINRLDKNMP